MQNIITKQTIVNVDDVNGNNDVVMLLFLADIPQTHTHTYIQAYKNIIFRAHIHTTAHTLIKIGEREVDCAASREFIQ